MQGILVQEVVSIHFPVELPQSTWWVCLVDFSCTHKSPICMHLAISDAKHDAIKKLSANSNTLFSHQSPCLSIYIANGVIFHICYPIFTLSNSYSSKQKLTYICKECLCMFSKVEAIIPFSTNNLKQHYTKVEDIGLHREFSFHCIF